MGVLRWESPDPPVNPEREKWTDIATELRSHPHEWAVVDEVRASSSTVAQRIKQATGVFDAFAPAGSFEAKSRTIRPGVVAIYARYVEEAV